MPTLDIDRYTAQIVPNTMTTVSGQYFDLNQPFAVPRYGNQCEYFITGREYMKAVADAIRGAKSFIMIADWQLDYDVELDNRGQQGHPGRLTELLAAAMQRGVHVRVLLYDAVNAVVDTHEETSRPALENLPAGSGSIKVMLQNANTGRDGAVGRSVPLLSENTAFAHHQKFVVVDGQMAFLGGMDLAYGRWETPAFQVVIDPAIHVLNDAYNQQLLPARAATAAERALLQPHNGKPGFAPPLGKDGKELLDPLTQPRQPWEDVALRVTGPAAFDVFVNFVLRWNSFAGTGTNWLDAGMDAGWFDRAHGPDYLVDPLKPGAGTANVQICRSASSLQLKDELTLWDNQHRYINDDWKTPNPARRKIVQAARAEWKSNQQTSIRDAMINCIRSAQAFIYIENQFFMSDCGPDQVGAKAPSTNPIIAELANAIGSAIYAGRPFHVWLVLPEHPEGMLEAKPTSSQAWWALQGVARAKNSLINRINAILYAKNGKAHGVTQPGGNAAQMQVALASWGLGDEWRKYLTVLNLRNYGKTSKGVLTEMVYVHTKLTIVDDAVAIIGSANINDRSLNGDGDTELAAVVVDNAQAAMTDVGGGVRTVTRKFARELRMQIWRKHFGMLVDEPTTGNQKASGPPAGIDLAKPLDSATIQGILGCARSNRAAYNKVFTHTPRDEFWLLEQGRMQYPRVMKRVRKYEVNGSPVGTVNQDGTLRDGYIWDTVPTEQRDFSKMPPLQPDFMKGEVPDIDKAAAYLRSNVKGFFVEMPLLWGDGEKKTFSAPAGANFLIADEPARSPAEEVAT